MDTILGMGVILGMVGACFVALFKMVDSQYPPVQIDVYDRGVKQRMIYRLKGTAIVDKNEFKLLMNVFSYCGDITKLEFDIAQARLFNIIPWGLTRIYRAYRRHDYLFGLYIPKQAEGVDKSGKKTEYMKTNTPPILNVKCDNPNRQVTVEFNKEGILFPIDIEYTNDKLKEQEVINGKQICSGFMQTQLMRKQFLDNSNPFITTLLAALPLLLIIILNGVVLYLILNGITDNITHISDTQLAVSNNMLNLTKTIHP